MCVGPALHALNAPRLLRQDKLVRVGRKLKKNNVAVDVVAFGSEDTNGEKLECFIEAVNSGDNSHLVTVPAGTILSDMLFGSPIFQARVWVCVDGLLRLLCRVCGSAHLPGAARCSCLHCVCGSGLLWRLLGVHAV